MTDKLTRAQRTNAIMAEVSAERERQVNVEGWTEAHDDAHVSGGMARAAACYAVKASYGDEPSKADRGFIERIVTSLWPWAAKWWKVVGKTPRRMLIVAAALIVAEVERIDRKAEGVDVNPERD